jgi:hypothetical protein
MNDRTFEPPNVDGMDTQELIEFRQVLARLHFIVEMTIEARALRLKGQIQDAIEYERRVEQAYQTLPDEYRW